MQSTTQPIVYISYSWVDEFDPGQSRWGRAPDPRMRELADRLRASGVDVRLDVYFRDSLHGFSPPQPVAGDVRDPWLVWAAQQIMESDVVLMFCTPEYAYSDPAHRDYQGDWLDWSQLDEGTRISQQFGVPARWWDWLTIARVSADRPQRVIPIGVGHYHRDSVPTFLSGQTYVDLSSGEGFDTLLRRIRQVWRERVPRQGIFLSYAHKDDDRWLDKVLTHLSWLERNHGIRIWSDRNILPGAKWHDMIQTELDQARVAMLLVSPEFLNSSYITSSELPKMLSAAQSEGMTIFWIPVRPSSYKRSPIAEFQAAHPPDKPLSGLTNAEQDQALVDIGEKLARVLGIDSR